MLLPEIVTCMGLHRSIVYRLLRTLEQHGLVSRDAHGFVNLGTRLVTLSAGVQHNFQTAASSTLRELANYFEATCFLVILDQNEILTLVSIEPSRSGVPVAERPGSKHPLGLDAPGHAVLCQLPENRWPPGRTPEQFAETRSALTARFAISQDRTILGLECVTVPLPLAGYEPMAIAVTYLAGAISRNELLAGLKNATRKIAAIQHQR